MPGGGRRPLHVVVAFGGDGTVNEAANGLAGSDVPLTCLPSGSTNVFCRTLGISADLVDATEHLLALADDFRPRRVDLGRVDDRHFVFASGIGLDASVVERVDSCPHLSTVGSSTGLARLSTVSEIVPRSRPAASQRRIRREPKNVNGSPFWTIAVSAPQPVERGPTSVQSEAGGSMPLRACRSASRRLLTEASAVF